MMKSLHQHLLVAGLLAGLGLTAVAQTAAPAAPAAPPAPAQAQAQAQAQRSDPAKIEQRQARQQQRMEGRLAALKQKLQVSGAQEGAWTAWTSAMQPTPHQRPDRAEIARLTTPERIDRMRTLRAARAAEMDKRGDATKTFYAALNADQKKVFDAESLHLGKRGNRGHGGHGHHHRG
jgi:TolA-binding protein